MISICFMEGFHKACSFSITTGKGRGRGALSDLRRRNAAGLLNHLRLCGPCTRPELARAGALDAKTVTNLMNILLKQRMVVSGGLAGSSGGRPAERIALNPDGAYAVGVDLGATRLRTALVDLTGGVRALADNKLKSPNDSGKILKQIASDIRATISNADLRSRRRIVGIGFASPGFLDREAGTVLDAVHIPGWKNVPVVEHLRRVFGRRVIMEEASRAMALGELWFGLGREEKNFVCLDIGFGIGVGIVSNGRLHYGVSETGGEIGHTTVKRNGLRCRCGKRGCLETVASGEAIGRLAKRSSTAAVAKAARSGDRNAKRIIHEAGTYLGIAAANLINLLNPGLLVLNGGLCRMGELLLEPFTKSLNRHAMSRSLSAAKIEQSALGDRAGAMGAATLALRPCFEYETAISIPRSGATHSGQ